MFAAVSPASGPTRATQMDPRGCPWVDYRREPKSFIVKRKYACSLLQSKTLIFPRLFTVNIFGERVQIEVSSSAHKMYRNMRPKENCLPEIFMKKKDIHLEARFI